MSPVNLSRRSFVKALFSVGAAVAAIGPSALASPAQSIHATQAIAHGDVWSRMTCAVVTMVNPFDSPMDVSIVTSDNHRDWEVLGSTTLAPNSTWTFEMQTTRRYVKQVAKMVRPA